MEATERNIRIILDDIAWELSIDDDPRIQEELNEQQANLERQLLDLIGFQVGVADGSIRKVYSDPCKRCGSSEEPNCIGDPWLGIDEEAADGS